MTPRAMARKVVEAPRANCWRIRGDGKTLAFGPASKLGQSEPEAMAWAARMFPEADVLTVERVRCA